MTERLRSQRPGLTGPERSEMLYEAVTGVIRSYGEGAITEEVADVVLESLVATYKGVEISEIVTSRLAPVRLLEQVDQYSNS